MTAQTASSRATTPNQEKSGSGRTVVHVVDDEPVIQNLFRQVGRLDTIEVRTYDRANEFLNSLDESLPGCLVLDLNLPDMSGLQVLEELARRDSHIPVVFMSGQANIGEAVRAIKLGSLDFLEKPFSLDDMTAAIRRALDFDRVRREEDRKRQELAERFASLTPRENEVMTLVVKGLPNKLIAAELGISPKTVEVHRANVMRKTGADSLADLVKMSMAAHGQAASA